MFLIFKKTSIMTPHARIGTIRSFPMNPFVFRFSIPYFLVCIQRVTVCDVCVQVVIRLKILRTDSGKVKVIGICITQNYMKRSGVALAFITASGIIL